MSMNSPDESAAKTVEGSPQQQDGNRQGNLAQANMAVILAGLQTMRDGDFSVRLPGYWTGLAGKVADTFNGIVFANQQIA